MAKRLLLGLIVAVLLLSPTAAFAAERVPIVMMVKVTN